ncbi:MAG: DUF2934 domain-containing protein [Phycisphaerales bacterium]|jgi:hypothetical protein|nr:DUF2934 domain-containing protein [Phycisphaerales bacterium]
MATSKKNASTTMKKPAAYKPTTATAATSTPVRNSAIPKARPVVRKEVTNEMIAVRAYEIWQSGNCGSDCDNWLRAERELRGL